MIDPSHRTLRALSAATIAGLLAVILAGPTAGAQQSPPGLAQRTATPRQHLDARVSPDGSLVAFRVGQAELGIVNVATGVEVIVFTSASASLESFLWDPSSASIYFLEGSAIRAIPRTGGMAPVIGTIAGTNVSLWTVDSTGTDLYGTRFDSAAGMTHVFRLATNGQSQPQDILSQQAVLDDVRIDPTDSFLLYRSWNGSPFTPVTYTRAPASGSPQTGLYTSGASDNVQSAHWIDNGQSFVMTTNSPTTARPHVGRVDSGGNLDLLTDLNYFHRRTVVGRSQRWVLTEMLSPDGMGITLGAIPPTGGGVVVLDRGQSLLFNQGGSPSEGLSIDDSGRVVAFSASTAPGNPPQIWVSEMTDEIRVSPRLETGQSFTMEMNVPTGQAGAAALSVGLNPGGPVSVPGIGGAFALDVTLYAIAMLGAGGPTPLSRTVPVPNDPSFIGFQLFFQGIRLGPGNDSFTRWGFMQVF